MKQKKEAKLAFLDVLISKTDQNLCTNVYRKTTSIGLYTSFVGFTPYSYKIGLIKTLIHDTYEISSSWASFNEEMSNVKHLLMKNMYPSDPIDKQGKCFVHNKFSTNYCNAVKEPKTTFYYKLPNIGLFSNNSKNKIKELCKKFCKNYNINFVFSPFKTGDLFSCKDCLPKSLKSFVVYKFLCAGCQSCYIGETKRHLPTRINEHLVTDKRSYIFKHLLENSACKNVCDENCFAIIENASSSFRLK